MNAACPVVTSRAVRMFSRVIEMIEELLDFGINLLRGEVGSFGEVRFEVYSGSLPHISYDVATGGWEGLRVKEPTRVMTFSNFRRRTRARYARHELINRKSLLEKVGDEPDQISFDVKLIRELGVKPEEEIERLREYIRSGHEDALIVGNEVLGKYVISESQEGREFVDCFGRTLLAEVALTFEEIGEEVQSPPEDANLPLIWL